MTTKVNLTAVKTFMFFLDETGGDVNLSFITFLDFFLLSNMSVFVPFFGQFTYIKFLAM